MPVLAVINRKGGSGKSTLATHLAAYCASSGLNVMLGDVDKQQSSLAWLRRRAADPKANAIPIAGWAADQRSVLRPPAGITHVVLDTPGGLRGFDLARVAMQADVILVPVCHSAFDREAAAECCAELMTLPRVSSGRCQIGVVGMRLDARTKADEHLAAWAARHQLAYVGSLRETQAYVRSSEHGMTLFDLPVTKVEADLAQWQPIIDWVQAAWQRSARADATAKASVKPNSRPTARPIDRPIDRALSAPHQSAAPEARRHAMTAVSPPPGPWTQRLATRLQAMMSAW